MDVWDHFRNCLGLALRPATSHENRERSEWPGGSGVLARLRALSERAEGHHGPSAEEHQWFIENKADDAAAIIEQDACRVSHRDEVDDLVQKGRELERQVLTRAVRLHLQRRVLIFGNRTIVFG
jgi:folate-dependent phosphoribosylglycinamide formyltransferase PurN